MTHHPRLDPKEQEKHMDTDQVEADEAAAGANPELVSWCEQNDLTSMLSKFVKAGFDSLAVMEELDSNDLDYMQIMLPGTRKKVLRAIRMLKEAQQHLYQQQPPPMALQSPDVGVYGGDVKKFPGFVPHPEPVRTRRPYKKVRRPATCKICHHYRRGKHQCTAADKCTNWETCPTQYEAGHPEVKQQRSNEKKRKREEEKRSLKDEKEKKQEESKRHKAIRREILKVSPLPMGSDFDIWFNKRLEEVVAAEPSKYSLDTKSSGRAAATRLIFEEHTNRVHRHKVAKARADFLKKNHVLLCQLIALRESTGANISVENDDFDNYLKLLDPSGKLTATITDECNNSPSEGEGPSGPDHHSHPDHADYAHEIQM